MCVQSGAQCLAAPELCRSLWVFSLALDAANCMTGQFITGTSVCTWHMSLHISAGNLSISFVGHSEHLDALLCIHSLLNAAMAVKDFSVNFP